MEHHTTYLKQAGKTIIYALLIFSVTACNHSKKKVIENGVLNLATTDTGRAFIRLNGSWDFYWDQYIQFNSTGNPNLARKAVVKVPQTWNRLHDSLKFKAFGKAVYHLHVKNNKTQKLALKFDMLIGPAYRVFIDQKEIFRSGNTGYSGNYKPAVTHGVVAFEAPPNDFNIYIETANYTIKKGGIFTSIKLGKNTSLSTNRNRNLFFEIMAIALVFAICIYSIVNYLFNKKHKALLIFSAIMLCAIIRLLSVSEIPIQFIFPGVPYVVVEHMRYLGLIAGFGLTVRFVKFYFAGHTPAIYFNTTQLLSWVLAVAITLAPTWLKSHIILFANLLSGFITMAALILSIKWFNKALVYKVATLIIAVFFITLIHDTLAANYLIRFKYISQYGILACAMFQIVYMVQDYKSLNRQFSQLLTHLTEYSIVHQKNKSKIQELSTRLKNINATIADPENKKELKNLLNKVNQHTTLSNNEQLALETLKKINIGFVDKLKANFPHLTKGETELCLMIRGNYSNKEISEARNINPASVKMARNRLRKKLQITSTIDLHEFITRI